MRVWKGSKDMRKIISALMIAALLAGCGGPSEYRLQAARKLAEDQSPPRSKPKPTKRRKYITDYHEVCHPMDKIWNPTFYAYYCEG